METEKLVIKHLSKRGELLDCINCPAAQVTVLRAEQDSDLIPFRQALHGDVSGQRFSIYFNGTEFQPRGHLHIGFGSWLNMELTVAEVLVQSGVPEGQVNGLAISYGLSDCLVKRVSSLSADLERRLEILAAVYSDCKILVMESPFEPIPQMWRDKFAELILNDTILKRRVTLLTRLCYRPEAWVGNSAINRVQVGSSVKKTIGFGQDSTEFNKLVQELRGQISSEQLPASSKSNSQFRQSEKLQGHFSSGSRNIKETLYPILGSHRTLLYGGAATSVCVAAFAFYMLNVPAQSVNSNLVVPLSEPINNLQVASKTGEAKVVNQEPMQTTQSQTVVSVQPNPAPEAESIKVSVATPPEGTSKSTSLDAYPLEIRKAIMEAFNEKDVDLGLTRTAYDPSKKPKVEEDDNPFRAISKLAPSKNSGPLDGSSSYYSPPNSEQDADFAARQEEIRRRFLEALQRANSNQSK